MSKKHRNLRDIYGIATLIHIHFAFMRPSRVKMWNAFVGNCPIIDYLSEDSKAVTRNML